MAKVAPKLRRDVGFGRVSKAKKSSSSSRRSRSSRSSRANIQAAERARAEAAAAERKATQEAQKQQVAQRQQQQQRQTLEAAQRQKNQAFISKYTSESTAQYSQQLESERFEKAQRFRIKLSDTERKQPKRKVIKQRFKEVGTGVAQGSIGLVEGAVNIQASLGTGQVKFDDAGNRIKQPKFKFGGKLGRIRDTPATTGTVIGQAGVYAPLVGAATTQFAVTTAKTGVATATRQAAFGVAPVKIQSGTYGALATQSRASSIEPRVVSIKQTTKGGLIRRDILGTSRTDPSVSIRSVQFSKAVNGRELGGAVTRVSAPETTIQYGKVTQGIRATLTKSATQSLGGKVDVFKSGIGVKAPKAQGTGSKAISQTFLNVRQDTSGLISTTKPSPIIKTRFGSTSTRGKVSTFQSGDAFRFISPKTGTSGVRFKKANVKGIEVALSLSKGGVSTGNRGVPSLKTIQSTKSAPFIATPTVSQATTPGTVSTVIPSISRTPSRTSPVQPPKLTQELQQKPQQKPVQTTVVIQSPKPRQAPKTRTISRSRSRARQAPATKQIPAVIQVPRQQQTPKTRQLTRTQQIAKQVPRGIGTGFAVGPRVQAKQIPFGFKIPRIKPGGRVGSGKGFGVQLRRYGTFRSVGTGLSKRQAISTARFAAGTTLGASVKITGPTKITSLPGFKKSKKEKGVFIEPRKLRLSTRGEKIEIRRAKLA